MHSRVLKSVIGVLALACVVLAPVALAAQDSAKKAQKTTVNDSPSKWDIFVGYSAFIPTHPPPAPPTMPSITARSPASAATSTKMSASRSRETSTF